MTSYNTLMTNSSTFSVNDIDNTYTRTNFDDTTFEITLTQPFMFNNINYTKIYVDTNGIINFTKIYDSFSPDIKKISELVGFFFPQCDFDFSTSENYGMYYKESNNIFTVIYNGIYYWWPSNLYQLKVNLYLNGHVKNGTIEYNYGIINNSNQNSVIGFSFGTSYQGNFLQNVDLFIPQKFTYPYSPYINITDNQSNYSNKQLSIIPASLTSSSTQNNSFVGFNSNKNKKMVHKRINKFIDNM